MYVYFNSSSKLVNGLKPVASEVCSLKLCASDNSDFIGPLVQENIIEGRFVIFNGNFYQPSNFIILSDLLIVHTSNI